MDKAVLTFELPQSLRDEAERLARLEGASLDEWLAFAIAQRVGSAEEIAALLKRKSASGRGRGLQFYLDRVPDAPPQEGDELTRL